MHIARDLIAVNEEWRDPEAEIIAKVNKQFGMRPEDAEKASEQIAGTAQKVGELKDLANQIDPQGQVKSKLTVQDRKRLSETLANIVHTILVRWFDWPVPNDEKLRYRINKAVRNLQNLRELNMMLIEITKQALQGQDWKATFRTLLDRCPELKNAIYQKEVVKG